MPTWTRTRERCFSGRDADLNSDSVTVSKRLGTKWPGVANSCPRPIASWWTPARLIAAR